MSSLGRLGSAALLGGATWLVAGLALAQESGTSAGALGSKNSFVLSLEHLGGYSYSSYERESGGDPTDGHQFGLFIPLFTPLGSRARLGLHYFVAPPLSLGVLASYSDNDYFGTYTLIGARVGAAFPISGSTSVWLRGGIAYARSKQESGSSEATYSALIPGGEILLALKPVEHFGFLVGGLFETAVGGKYERKISNSGGSNDQDLDFKQMEVALSLGVFLDF